MQTRKRCVGVVVRQSLEECIDGWCHRVDGRVQRAKLVAQQVAEVGAVTQVPLKSVVGLRFLMVTTINLTRLNGD